MQIVFCYKCVSWLVFLRTRRKLIFVNVISCSTLLLGVGYLVELHRLICKRMSNFYLKVTIEKKKERS